MPEYKRDAPEADWFRTPEWALVRAKLEELRRNGDDIAEFRVRTGTRDGDEASAAEHPETQALFRERANGATEAPAVDTVGIGSEPTSIGVPGGPGAPTPHEAAPTTVRHVDAVVLPEEPHGWMPEPGGHPAVSMHAGGPRQASVRSSRASASRPQAREAKSRPHPWHSRADKGRPAQRVVYAVVGLALLAVVGLAAVGIGLLYWITADRMDGNGAQTGEATASAADASGTLEGRNIEGRADVPSTAVEDREAEEAVAGGVAGGSRATIAEVPTGANDGRGGLPAGRAAEDALGLDRAVRRQVQEALRDEGHDPGPADGMFGAGTREAIRRWQAARGVDATGFLGAADVNVLTAGRGNRREPSATAEPGSGGSLSVRAEPGSRIELDGRPAGSTNDGGVLALSDLQPGRHTITARMEGREPATRVVEVSAGRSEVVELILEALPGALTVTANVSEAMVRIEGLGDHALPVARLAVPAGSRRVVAAKPGFLPVETTVEVRPDELTTLNLVLEPVPVEQLLQRARNRFDLGDYRAAIDEARSVLEVRADAGEVNLLLGRALYEIGAFRESVNFLHRAIVLGEEVELLTNHRHGGAGFNPSFCRGALTLSRDAVSFRSFDDPDHAFSVAPGGLTNLRVAETTAAGGVLRLNASVRGGGRNRRNFDFLHRNTRRERADPDAPALNVLTCRDCDASMDVQAQLMDLLSRQATR